jgi:hypothetical protein
VIDELRVRGQIGAGRDGAHDLALQLEGHAGPHGKFNNGALLDTRGGLPGESLLHVHLAEHAVAGLVRVPAAGHLAVLAGDGEHVDGTALKDLGFRTNRLVDWYG